MGAKIGSWRDVHDKFKLLANEQRKMLENERLCVYRDRNPLDRGAFFFVLPEMGPWTISKSPNRVFRKKFEAQVNRAGAKLLGPSLSYSMPRAPCGYWLDRLYAHLLENVSPLLIADGTTCETIKSVCEASAAYCDRLETEARETAASAKRQDATRGKLRTSQVDVGDNLSSTRGHRRLSASIKSPVAARRLQAYLESKAIGQTNFAIQVGTTDRTLRSFRKTGKVRRDIFDAIAKGMGTTTEALSKPE